MPDNDSNGNSKTKVAVMANDVQHIKNEVSEIKQMLLKQYVTKLEFEPVKRLVYGTVGIIGGSILVAVLAFVLRGA